MRIPFGAWLPDLPPNDNPGMLEAFNTLPAVGTYRPFNSLMDISTTALTGDRACGLHGAVGSDGVTYIVAGDTQDLYFLSGTSFVKRGAGSYSTSSDGWWTFARFGQQIVATNGTAVPQACSLSSSLSFTALGGSPPVAKYCAVVDNFVVLANISGSPQRVRWSGIDNSAYWPTPGTTDAIEAQSDQQDLVGDGGEIKAIVGGNPGYIFQERAIWRMQYRGAPLIFDFQMVEPGRGTPSPKSVVQYGDQVFYLGQDGFYAFRGGASVPIGAGKVDNWFFGQVNNSAMWAVSGAIDPERQVVFWAYPEGTLTRPSSAIMYNWAADRWAHGELSAYLLSNIFTSGLTLEEIGAIYTDLDALPASLDSSVWQGGRLLLAGISSNLKLATLTGTPAEALLTTQEIEFAPGRRTLLTGVRPLADGTIVQRVSYRETAQDSPTYTVGESVDRTGRCAIRVNSRLHRFHTSITGAWTYAQGVDIDDFGLRPAGRK